MSSGPGKPGIRNGPGNDLEFGKKILKTWNFVEVDFIGTKVSKYEMIT